MPPLYTAGIIPPGGAITDEEKTRTLRTSLNTLGDGFVEAIPDGTLISMAAKQKGDTHQEVQASVTGTGIQTNATERANQPAPQTTEVQNQPAVRPTEMELRAAIQRTYADAVTVDNSRSTPFMTGDFNGDNSEDIAIVVKPRGNKLSDLNSEYVNWILEDPHHVQQLSRNVKANDVLLAVIHGHDRQGWRNELAKQTYLLKNAVGTELATESLQQLRISGENRSLPQLRGDVIREKLNGSGGIIYWTGAKYAWHPVI